VDYWNGWIFVISPDEGNKGGDSDYLFWNQFRLYLNCPLNKILEYFVLQS
jgi:hypothetical protein